MAFKYFTLVSDMDNAKKTIFLLFFCTFSYYMTLKHRPFILYRLNILEQQSNLAILLTVFSGSLYVLGVNEFIKTTSFIFILIVNFRFFMIWFFAVAKIYLSVYGKKVFKYFPNCLNFFAIWQKTSNMTESSFNLVQYFMEFSRNFRQNSELFSLKAI